MARQDDVIARAKAGDHDAWRELYLLHASRLVALLRLVTSGDSVHDHEDLAAQAWLTAADRIATFEGTADAFGGWLYVIARNHARRVHTRATHRAAAVPAGGSGDLVDIAPAHDLESESEQIAGVAERLAILPDKQRQVVAFIDVLGYDTATTAEALAMTRTAVRVNRHRALARLRDASDQR